MHVQLDEQQQQHIYGCLLVGNEKFQNVKKNLGKLDYQDDKIDDEIAVNAELRRMFNPRAEEEARERQRAKSDPAQMDLTQVPSSGETGGGHPAGERIILTTPAAMTDVELRDSLVGISRVVSLTNVRAWTQGERDAVITWVGQVLAGSLLGATVPDEPECLASVAMSTDRFNELLETGPYVIQSAPNDEGWEVLDRETLEVDETLVDKVDAEVRVSRLNRGRLMHADISRGDVEKWSNAGPWGLVVGIKGEIEIRTGGTDRESCDSTEEALGRAARYNRTIAQREWVTSNTPPTVTDDAVQEIKAAAEAGEGELDVNAINESDDADFPDVGEDLDEDLDEEDGAEVATAE